MHSALPLHSCVVCYRDFAPGSPICIVHPEDDRLVSVIGLHVGRTAPNQPYCHRGILIGTTITGAAQAYVDRLAEQEAREAARVPVERTAPRAVMRRQIAEHVRRLVLAAEAGLLPTINGAGLHPGRGDAVGGNCNGTESGDGTERGDGMHIDCIGGDGQLSEAISNGDGTRNKAAEATVTATAGHSALTAAITAARHSYSDDDDACELAQAAKRTGAHALIAVLLAHSAPAVRRHALRSLARLCIAGQHSPSLLSINGSDVASVSSSRCCDHDGHFGRADAGIISNADSGSNAMGPVNSLDSADNGNGGGASQSSPSSGGTNGNTRRGSSVGGNGGGCRDVTCASLAIALLRQSCAQLRALLAAEAPSTSPPHDAPTDTDDVAAIVAQHPMSSCTSSLARMQNAADIVMSPAVSAAAAAQAAAVAAADAAVHFAGSGSLPAIGELLQVMESACWLLSVLTERSNVARTIGTQGAMAALCEALRACTR